MKKATKIIIPVIILLAAVGAWFFLRGRQGNETPTMTNPRRGPIAVEFRLNGSVQPRNRLEIKPQFSGRIEEILVSEGQEIKRGEILAWMSSMDRAALLDAARVVGEEEYSRWLNVYRPAPIIAPLDGFIIARLKEPGQTISSSEALLVMADELIVEANVDETDLSRIELGQRVNIFLDAYPNERFPAEVEHIAFESQVISNVTVYPVKINPLEVPPQFRAGMSTTVRVKADERENALLLPLEAVIDRRGGKFIRVKNPQGKLEEVPVETGISDGRRIEIVSDLSESAEVAVPRLAGSSRSGARTTGGPFPATGGAAGVRGRR